MFVEHSEQCYVSVCRRKELPEIHIVTPMIQMRRHGPWRGGQQG